ncbi:dihydrofolate reductase [Natronospirillum operosum]|uniref:Dihydrofolate reductase n=1 Tax=Natronospirillum operosum TaxID=2759953 RepID=A0A4Z0W7F7_9GAMM|nr:dihydrofolate reductase [Natronospirillum operosum]TGG90632.1 dihydrofolate reductase [Natronospirillum operosum]
MRKALIWAQARNRVIGRNNKLPWYLPEDLRFFKRTTFGKPVIMGRRTFDSIGKPLPGRANIIITRHPDDLPATVTGVTSLEQAIDTAEANALVNGEEEIIIMGGAQIYELALPQADRLYVTHVHADVEGDALFPEVDWAQFQEVSRADFKASGPNPYDYSFVVYDRVE